jgi:hypothetical protein
VGNKKMIEETEKILIEYLQVEIEKMQKTAGGLEKMIDEFIPWSAVERMIRREKKQLKKI